ncbi:MAG: hypothetical protein HY370_06985, partial [Proteobacteria bacterium]|nr:hypothetical protein [Pseudomonadota bacterium]
AYDQPSFSPHMKLPLAVSFLFHVSVFLFSVATLPYISPRIEDVSDPIPVEIIREDERATDKKPAQFEAKRQPPQQIEKPPEKMPDRPPQMTAKTPPKPVAPVPPDAVPLPSKEKTAETKAAQPPKPDKRKPFLIQDSQQDQQEEFKSLLKNLMPDQPAPQENSQAQDKAAESSPLARFAQQMSGSEMDSLRSQLSRCWKMMSGARNAEDLAVDIKLFINPDRTIRDAQIADSLRYYADSHYRAAADSALRAVRNPGCNPLDLPPDKYEMWKVMTVTFDPRDML